MRRVEFRYFQDQWSPFLVSKAVGRKRPVGAIFDGVPVVLFRDHLGRIQALVDRCPHRSVKLSVGTLKPDGTLQCAFHGWRFDGDGACKSIPLNADAKLGAVCAQRVGVAEHGGLIWLNGASDPSSVPALQIPASLTAEGWYGSTLVRDWNCHWSRAIQTMLDVAHIPFVHPQSIGAAFGRALGKATNAHLSHDLVSAADGSFRMSWKLLAGDAGEAGDQGWVEFHPPNGMSLGIPQKTADRRSVLHIWCVPLEENRSRMIVAARRNFGKYAVVPRLYDILTPVILGEDRRNMDTVWPSEVPESGEVSVPSDAPTIAFQKYYRETFLFHHPPNRSQRASPGSTT